MAKATIIAAEHSVDADAPDTGKRTMFPKSDGWYERDAAGTVKQFATGSGAALPVVDSTAIVKGSLDDTKQVRIEADTNVPTATTVVLTAPAADITLGTDADAIHDNIAGEIAAITEKVTPVSGDFLVIEDSAAANAKKRVQIGNLPGGGAPTTSEYLTTASDGSLSAEVVIPGLAGSGDVLGTGGGGTVDREFDASGGTKFTWDIAPLTEDIDTTIKSHYYITFDNTGGSVKLGNLAWTPAGAFDARMKFCTTSDITNLANTAAGFLITDADDSDFVLVNMNNGNVSAFTFTASTLTQRGNSIPTDQTSWVYARIVRDGSNNVSFYHSANGVIWSLIATQAFTFTVAGIGVRAAGADTPDSYMAIDWLRTDV
jgi:hypothetical protein